jgi:amidase
MGLASEFVLARSVRDAVAVLEAVARPCTGRFLDQPRVAIALTPRAGAAQIAAVRAAAEGLADSGCRIREIGSAPLDALGARAAAVARTILSVSLAEWLDSLGIGPGEVSALAAAIAAEGRAVPASALFAAAREMARIGHAFDALLDDADAILTPVLSGPPPPIGHFDMTRPDPAAHFAAMEALAPNAALANVAGAPALVLPVVVGESRLPVGVQLAGKRWTDRALLALGARLEAASPRPRFPYPIAGLPR